MVLVKNWPFFQLLFLGQIGREQLFGNVLNRIIAFLYCKNININRRKICIFPKGIVHNFLGKIGRNDLLDIRIAPLDYKNINIKRSQNLQFSKGVSPWFWSKIGHLLNFSF